MKRSILVALMSCLFVYACGSEHSADHEPDSGDGGEATTAADELFGHTHEDGVVHYTCAMHPSIRSPVPGSCPICSMELVPVRQEEVSSGEIVLDARRRQTIGVRTAPVETRSMDVAIRAVGKIVYDESRMAVVTVKYKGFIGELFADRTGMRVHAQQPLFTLYSPDLYAAQEELLTAIASQRSARETSAPDRVDYLVDATRKRLELWDLRPEQIDAIIDSGKPTQYLPILSPVSGYVIQKHVVAGQSVEPGEDLFHIAALDRIWIEAEVYESELPLVRVGQSATITLPYLPGKKFNGSVAFVYPYLEHESRTGRVRVELPNPGLELKPEMYANVDLGTTPGERLVVPEEAVLYAGPRRLVFVDLGEGRLQPREIEIGAKSGDYYEVLSGLEIGDVVVTSGNFLVAAESRLKSVTKQW